MGIFNRKKKKKSHAAERHPIFKDLQPRCTTCRREEPLHPVHKLCHDCYVSLKRWK